MTGTRTSPAERQQLCDEQGCRWAGCHSGPGLGGRLGWRGWVPTWLLSGLLPARPPTLQNRVFSCLYKGDRIYLSELLPGFPIIIVVRCVCASSGALIQYSLISDDGELCRT